MLYRDSVVRIRADQDSEHCVRQNPHVFLYADCQVRILSICGLSSPHIINMLTVNSAYYQYADGRKLR